MNNTLVPQQLLCTLLSNYFRTNGKLFGGRRVFQTQLMLCFYSTAFGHSTPSHGGAVMMLQGGEVCEETGASRSLKTSITCCATDQMEADGRATSPMAILVSIQV